MDKKIKTLSVYRKNLAYNTLGELDTNQPEYLASQTEFEMPHGKPVKDTTWNAEGQMEQQMVYTYTPDGFLLTEEMLDTDGSVLEKRTFEPDSMNQIATEFLHYADGSVDCTRYFRDEQNRIVRKEMYADGHELEWKETFHYEGENRLRELKTDQYGNPLVEITYKHNAQGKIAEMQLHNSEEDLYFCKKYEYDLQGHITTATTYDKDGEPLERLSFENDEMGRPLSTVDENKRQKNTATYEYNERGDVVFQIEHDRHGQLIKQLEKTYGESGILLQTQVLVRDFHTGVSRSYNLRNSYEFFDI